MEGLRRGTTGGRRPASGVVPVEEEEEEEMFVCACVRKASRAEWMQNLKKGSRFHGHPPPDRHNCGFRGGGVWWCGRGSPGPARALAGITASMWPPQNPHIIIARKKNPVTLWCFGSLVAVKLITKKKALIIEEVRTDRCAFSFLSLSSTIGRYRWW